MSLQDQYDALCVYLLSCYARKDWHGVSDAANDIRVFEAKYPALIEREIPT
jgi:hypothetical protein